MPYMNVFLEKLSRTHPEDHILLILDNAAWHLSSTMVVLGSIELYPLLPYTPGLNPVQRI